MTTGYYCAIFPFCGGGKKNNDKNRKAFYDWATTGISVINFNSKANHSVFSMLYTLIKHATISQSSSLL